MMDADTYQEQAMRTAGDVRGPGPQHGLIVAALGLTGEAGEVADLVKKHVAQGHPIEREKLLEEAGDIAWYLARLCAALDARLGDVLQANIEKLWRRYPEGFSTEASLRRVDTSS
ncbi:MAG TPA: nucleoside triphosphate pyrophosphohydrolase family protein [Ktedonobacterales bacterium]